MKTNIRSFLIALTIVSTLKTHAQVPVLNSLPAAQAVIFIDFDGHNVTGTSWNYDGPVFCAPSGLNNTQITTIFNRVAEDYRPFNVNITTDSTKFLAAPVGKRMRVLATVSYEWYGLSGGVAFVGSFTWGDDSPCFVFTSLLSYNMKNIAEAISHEAGHTLNLQHQSVYDAACVKTGEYNYGQGTGEIGWAPIMGAGYYQNLTLWNNGKSSEHCDSLQNDLTVITNGNGFGFRTDDFVATFAGATNAPFVSNQFMVNGIIGQTTDQDMIKFTQPSIGRFQLNAVPYNVGTGNAGSDLDMQVTLYNSSQTQLNIYNPGILLSSVVDTQLNPGTYYLRVEGKGNIYAPNYASLGSYSLQGNFTSGALPLRRLELTGEIVSDKHRLTWIIDADETVTKQILEVSTDGRNFIPVTQSANELRSFMYKPYVTTTALYRLNVTFDNDRQYYSNIVSLQSKGAANWPKLINTITNTTIMVTSPGTCNYAIYEFSGKTVSKGQLVSGLNTINTTPITSGMYIIRFDNGAGQWTDKFIKQ
ncbi:MAG: T9SS type A sorting domain-containing protein [Ferruginibacter sp.]|nr:T9SS type A sorting domain-containing protein [Chitinophagaceae bacterium]